MNLKRNVPEAPKQPLTIRWDLATSRQLSQQSVSCHSEVTPFQLGGNFRCSYSRFDLRDSGTIDCEKAFLGIVTRSTALAKISAQSRQYLRLCICTMLRIIIFSESHEWVYFGRAHRCTLQMGDSRWLCWRRFHTAENNTYTRANRICKWCALIKCLHPMKPNSSMNYNKLTQHF